VGGWVWVGGWVGAQAVAHAKAARSAVHRCYSLTALAGWAYAYGVLRGLPCGALTGTGRLPARVPPYSTSASAFCPPGRSSALPACAAADSSDGETGPVPSVPPHRCAKAVGSALHESDGLVVLVSSCAEVPCLQPYCAHRCHICTGTGLAAATSAPELGSPLPHLHRDRLAGWPTHCRSESQRATSLSRQAAADAPLRPRGLALRPSAALGGLLLRVRHPICGCALRWAQDGAADGRAAAESNAGTRANCRSPSIAAAAKFAADVLRLRARSLPATAAPRARLLSKRCLPVSEC
jgi:hypothetical protein